MLPLDMSIIFGKAICYLIFLIIGIGFGFALEMAGFGDSRKLAAQFYFKDMTVLKVMFTAIVVACVLIFFTSSLGLFDFSKIFVNPTYLWPGIIGGLFMGVGFVIGGYCPGTSIVSAASLKIDGIVFFVGAILGAGIFGETVSLFSDFWNSSYSERLLLSDWLGWSIGATVAGVTVLALFMFYAAEKVEEYFRNGKFSWPLTNKKYLSASAAVLFLALLTWTIGQPTPERKWNMMGSKYQSQLDSREVFLHPLEYVKTWNNDNVKLITLDLRPQSEFEKFHLEFSKSIVLDNLKNAKFVAPLIQLPPQSVVVIISDNEAEAVKAWQWLKIQGASNLYILENGLRNWAETFKGITLPYDEEVHLARLPKKILELFPKDTFKTKIQMKTDQKGGGLCR